jgi:hypothetical protein
MAHHSTKDSRLKKILVLSLIIFLLVLSSCSFNFENSRIGYANGTITDSYFVIPIRDATLDFFAGINTTSGTLLHTTTTDPSGYYSISTDDLGSEGNFTARISRSGYTNATINILLVKGTTRGSQDALLVPDDVYHVLLDWDVTPLDLDSHLTGPTEGFDRFHTYYYKKFYTPAGLGLSDVTLAETSNRSESTTIYFQRSGEYRFYIHDYSNRTSSASSPSTALSNSGARVRVYRGSNLLATYNVPTGYGGNCWDVFKLSGTSLTAVNTLSYISDYAIGRNLGRENIFVNLPEKN